MHKIIHKVSNGILYSAMIIVATASYFAISTVSASETRIISLPFLYTFSQGTSLEESGSMDKSASPYFWLNSGAYLNINGDTAKSVQGPLSKFNKWRLLYSASNADETDNGYYPQNVFRLFTRTKWQDVAQQTFFKINKYNLSPSTSRAASNGLFLVNRMGDGNNLYYTGLRVDGYAVIKKKILGTYYTMAYVPVITTPKYNRDTNPNLLPTGKWIGLRTEVKNVTASTVNIKFFVDIGKTGVWTLAAEVTDDGKSFGGSFLQPGYAGVRTDFMDVELDDYLLANAP